MAWRGERLGTGDLGEGTLQRWKESRPCPCADAQWNIRGSRAPRVRRPHCVKIVPRYVLREHLGPLVFALSALTSLLLLNFIAKRFGKKTPA